MKRVLFILTGIIFIGVGVYTFVNARGLSKRCIVETVGTVINVKTEERYEEEDGITRFAYIYYPVIEYTAGEKTITKQSDSGSDSSSKYKVNDKVDILYNPDNVEEYIIKGDKTSNFVGILFAVAGISVVIIGVIKRF